MTRMIGLALLSLLLASPAMAMHHTNYRHNNRALSVQDALDFGYSEGVCGYHSGRGGLYGDGLYPDNVCKDGGSHLID